MSLDIDSELVEILKDCLEHQNYERKSRIPDEQYLEKQVAQLKTLINRAVVEELQKVYNLLAELSGSYNGSLESNTVYKRITELKSTPQEEVQHGL